jgi:hypothetical protein
MKGLKGVIVIATIIAAAATLGACEKSYKDVGSISVQKTFG